MMMKTLKFLLAVIIAGMIGGCNDFFEENSQNQAYVESVVDLDELLVGECYIIQAGFPNLDLPSYTHLMQQTRNYFPWIHLLDDDITEYAAGGYRPGMENWNRSRARAGYGWDRNPFVNHEGVDYLPDDWTNMYKRIAVLNSIIYELGEDNLTRVDTLMPRVEGEARFLRAYYYYWLVNIYAQPYSPETAALEPGVPLKTSEVVEDKYFSRASVLAVYDQIKDDLRHSIDAFRDAIDPLRPLRANYTAACLLMSRVCLYTEDYEGAVAYADSAIQRGRHSLADLNVMNPDSSFTHERSPETVFTQGGYIMPQIHQQDYDHLVSKFFTISSYTTSRDLLDCYHENDLRKDHFFVPAYNDPSKLRCLKYKKTTGRIGDYMLFRIPEAYLNKAEAQAIMGDEAGAKVTLNILRKKRFLAGNMPSIEEEMAESGEDLVNFIRTERRREFCYEGQRWFDLRRYAVNSRHPFTKAIRHDHYEWQGGEDGFYVLAGYYELKPYPEDKAAYVFPLPADEIVFNKGELEQNPIRPERDVIPY